MADAVSLMVTIPVCSFRKGYSREYLETEKVPPPSTVYGFLLSLIGEEERHKYEGVQIAYGLLKKPQRSVIMRTVWRVKKSKTPLGSQTNKRPDYQEILTELAIGIWIRAGDLADKVTQAGASPEGIDRYGGLSLGESRDLINDILWSPAWPQPDADWLTLDPQGSLSLPVWVDHVGSAHTVWRQFNLVTDKLETPSSEDPRWITITSARE